MNTTFLVDVLSDADFMNPYPPADLASFWEQTLRESAEQPLKAKVVWREDPDVQARVADVSFEAFNGGRLNGFLLLPLSAEGRIPCFIWYHGYMATNGEPKNFMSWVEQGFAVLSMDVRGQPGKSQDEAKYPGEKVSGLYTQGMLDPYKHYFRNVYTDAIRNVDFVNSLPEIDPQRIAVSGESQGGAYTLAVACLDHRVTLAMPDIPSYMNIPYHMAHAQIGVSTEYKKYLQRFPERKEKVYRTLSYFDLANHLENMQCPSLWSAGGKDPICLIKSTKTAFKWVKVKDKKLVIYPKLGHASCPEQWKKKLAWSKKKLSVK